MQDFASEYVSRTKPSGGTKLRLIVDIDKVTTEYARQLAQANMDPGEEIAAAADRVSAQLKATAEKVLSEQMIEEKKEIAEKERKMAE